MRTFLVLICSLAIACAAGGAQKEDKSKKGEAPKKKQAQSAQYVTPSRSGPTKAKGSQDVTTARHHSADSGSQKTKGKTKGSQQIATQGGQAAGRHFDYGGGGGTGKVRTQDYHVAKSKERKTGAATAQSSSKTKQKIKGAQSGQVGRAHQTTASGVHMKSSQTKTYKAKNFDLSVNTRPATIKGVTFQQNRRIVGSQSWRGPSYTVFRTYTPVWHDRIWWRNNYNRIVFVYGGWYYWNTGWWYPAWGYAPNAYYAYDGPIYAYNDLPPDQVIANVQAALQQQGYYQGEVDGLLGPLTRAAIADYQRDRGLYETAAIDQPTLESLGMA
jgi:hypothetical protein